MNPPPIKFSGLPNGIPALSELMGKPQWVAWRYEYRNGPDEKPTKPPVSPRTGFGASHSKPQDWGTYQQALQMAARRNLPGVGFVLSPGDEYTGIDLDDCLTDDGDIAPWAREIIDLAETYCEVSPSGNGLRLIARGKIDKTVKCDPASVEIYRDSRYLTITGNHWPGTPSKIEEAPRTLELLHARVEAMRPKKEAASPAPMPSRQLDGDFFSNVNRRALECLTLWVPSLFPSAKFQQSTGAFRISSRDLGRDLQEDLSIAPNGIKDWGVHDMGDPRDGGRTAIDICLEHGGHADAKEAAFWLCGRMGAVPVNLGWEEIPEHDPIEAKSAADNLIRNHDAKAAVAVSEDDMEAEAEDDENIGGAVDYLDIQDALLRPPGVVGEIADWICSTTGEPIRVHAVGAALIAVGALVARKVYSKTRPTGTHLYIGALAPSGVGKDHPQTCLKAILGHVTGQFDPQFIGWAGSAPKLGNKLMDHAAAVMIADEFSDKFVAIRGRNASTSTAAISEAFRELWGRSIGSYEVPTALSRSDTIVHRPALSFFGATTIANFKKSLIEGDIVNGLYNRFLFLPRYGEIESGEEMDGMPALPERLAQRCSWLHSCIAPMQVSLAVKGDGYPAEPILVPFSDEASRMNDENRALQKAMQRRADDDPALALYGRYAEQIKRIALILACGRTPEMLKRAEISADDMRFAQSLVGWSIEQAVLMVRRDMVESWVQAQHNLVLGIIRKAKTISRSKLYRMVRGRMKARDLDEVIKALCAGRNVGSSAEYTTTNKRTEYRYLRG